MHEGEELRAEFEHLSRGEQPPIGLHADLVIDQARRVRRRRTSATMLISGGLTAAVILLVAVVLPSIAGQDEHPLVPADQDHSVVEPTPSSIEPAPEDPAGSASPESKLQPGVQPEGTGSAPDPSATLSEDGFGHPDGSQPPGVTPDTSEVPSPGSPQGG